MVAEGDPAPEQARGLAQVAAATTAFIGGLAIFFMSAHLYGVLVTASRGRYATYDFRLAALLIVGMTAVVGGVVCLTAVRGLARGRRSAWGRALIGTVLLLVVWVPLGPIQPDMAPTFASLAALNLLVLLGAWRGLERPARPAINSSLPPDS
jgi:hypothetical protein